VYGAGARMGVGIRAHLLDLGEKAEWFSCVFGYLEWIPVAFWFVLFSLHHLVKLIKVFPAAVGYLEGTRDCRVWGVFPVFCKDVGPHWFLYWIDAGAKGLFLCVGAMGMALRVLSWEYGHPLLGVHRMSLRKAAAPLVVVAWLTPSWLGDFLIPVHWVLSFIMVNAEMTRQTVVMFTLATVVAQVTGVPVYLVLWGITSLFETIKISQGNRYSEAKDRDTQFLHGWLADVFGRVEIKKSVCREIDFVLSINTTDDAWKKIRVYAYAGDKLAYYYNGVIGLESNLEVGQVQSKGRIFDDEKLKRAMQFFATRWWKNQPLSMMGKPSSTVLEAVSYLVLSELGYDSSLVAVKHYIAALERVDSYLERTAAVRDSSRSNSLESEERFGECLTIL